MKTPIERSFVARTGEKGDRVDPSIGFGAGRLRRRPLRFRATRCRIPQSPWSRWCPWTASATNRKLKKVIWNDCSQMALTCPIVVSSYEILSSKIDSWHSPIAPIHLA
mmetsp:Transcript_63420/g.138111  ORF Transcript_63420/g.138111 Transcript_63420/m.138111 type:complete len:108 (+) Transcript_63420:1730-2053(+)